VGKGGADFPVLGNFQLQNFQGSDKVSHMNRFTLQTRSRTDFINIDRQVGEVLVQSGMQEGVVMVFVPHTTAGVTINENADPDVMADLEDVLDRAVPWAQGYRHMEGNTAAHAKASMMGSSIQVIVSGGKLQLGTWQSLYFCEFDGPRTRQVWIKGISTE
jgi:secondary thiamine-phosphate synthase enzyme